MMRVGAVVVVVLIVAAGEGEEGVDEVEDFNSP